MALAGWSCGAKGRTQIPFGNDNRKSNCNGHSRRRVFARSDNQKGNCNGHSKGSLSHGVTTGGQLQWPQQNADSCTE
jgi:hypothetical protein